MFSARYRCVLAAVCVLAGGSPARGQIAEQKILTLSGARTVADAAAAEARKHNAGGAIAVVDTGGNLLFLQRLDNTFPAAAAVAIEKARTAATFRRPTRDFENAIKNGRTSLLGVSVMTPLQGGVPIVADGQVLGAVGVSGATSAQEDDDIATAASTALGTAPASATAMKP